jgi:hypothetical protein
MEQIDTGGESGTKSRRKTVSKILSDIEGKLGDRANFSIADFIRLCQFERELVEEEQPTEIKVTWIEPTEYDLAA